MTAELSRRRFLAGSAMYGGALWLTLNMPRPRTAAAAAATSERASLSEAEWKTVEAMCGRIIPRDDAPGAVEAGCVNFIDKALANEDSALAAIYHEGLPTLDEVAKRRHEKPFAALEASQQDAILTSLQDEEAPEWKQTAVSGSDFFETVRAHTVMGFLADPLYGGNRNYAGWKLVGYPGPRHHAGGYTVEQMSGEAPIVAIWGEKV